MTTKSEIRHKVYWSECGECGEVDKGITATGPLTFCPNCGCDGEDFYVEYGGYADEIPNRCKSIW